jgi:hypothetical protein
MQRIPYAAIFSPPRILGSILAQDDFSYLSEPPSKPAPGSVLLHVSCQTLTVSHIPYLAQKILQRLGVDFVTVGGAENCCGAAQWANGDDDYERQVATLTLSGFRRVQPVKVLSTCPDCDSHFRQYMKKQHTFEHMNVVRVFLDNAEKLKSLMKKPVNRRVIVHAHYDNEARAGDAESVRALMNMVPGIEIIESEKARGHGNHCLVKTGRYDSTVHDDVTHAMFADARASGADSLVVPYHGCYRQHCKRQLEYGVEVQHYLSILAEALEIPYQETFKELRLLDDIDQAMERLRPRIETHDYTVEEIRPFVQAAIYV